MWISRARGGQGKRNLLLSSFLSFFRLLHVEGEGIWSGGEEGQGGLLFFSHRGGIRPVVISDEWDPVLQEEEDIPIPCLPTQPPIPTYSASTRYFRRLSGFTFKGESEGGFRRKKALRKKDVSNIPCPPKKGEEGQFRALKYE